MYKNIYYFNFIPEIEFARFFHQDLQLRLHVIRLRKSHNLRPARPTSKADKENTSTNVISRPRRNLFSGQRVHDLFSSRFTSYDQLSFESTVHQFSSAWLEPCIKNVLSVCMAFCFLSLSLSTAAYIPEFLVIPASLLPARPPSPQLPIVSLSVETYISLPTFFLSPPGVFAASRVYPRSQFPARLFYFVSFTSHTSRPDKVLRVPPRLGEFH